MSQHVHYYFSPAVRRGLASAITADPTGPRASVKVRATVTAAGAGEESKELARDMQVFGPGDILGFDARVVARTDPRPRSMLGPAHCRQIPPLLCPRRCSQA